MRYRPGRAPSTRQRSSPPGVGGQGRGVDHVRGFRMRAEDIEQRWRGAQAHQGMALEPGRQEGEVAAHRARRSSASWWLSAISSAYWKTGTVLGYARRSCAEIVNCSRMTSRLCSARRWFRDLTACGEGQKLRQRGRWMKSCGSQPPPSKAALPHGFPHRHRFPPHCLEPSATRSASLTAPRNGVPPCTGWSPGQWKS